MLDILVPEVGLQSSRTGVSMTKQTAKQTRSNQIVGNVGMYFVAYRLSLMGWNVMPTCRNARGIDLLAYDANARHFLGIHFKTLSKRNGAVPLGLHAPDNLLGDWWIIVTNIAKVAENENPIWRSSVLATVGKLFQGKF